MPAYALIDPRTNRVTHLVEADPDWMPPAGLDKALATAETKIGEPYGQGGPGGNRPPVEERRAQTLARLRAQQAAIQAEGVPLEDGRRVPVNERSMALLATMAATAGLALIGATPWPEEYARGWIAADNTRLPLPKPQDAIALVAAVTKWDGGLAHRARDLKDAALTAADPEGAVAAKGGWDDFARPQPARR